MKGVLSISRVRELPPDIDALALEAASEGFRFVQRLLEEWKASQNRFDLPGEALFVAHIGAELVGVCGLNRDPYSGRFEIGRVRRLYVRPRYRRRGVARSLTTAVIEMARGTFPHLRLRTDNPEAAKFYEALGFERIQEAEASHRLLLSDPA